MKWSLIVVPVLVLAASVSAKAQSPAGHEPVGHEPKSTVSISPGQLSPTPEMWFYEQSLARYQDRKVGVRDKAEFRTAERLRRIAALRWYGLSGSRPTVGADVIHGDGGAHWTSGAYNAPNQWSATTAAVLAPTGSQNTSR